MRDVRKGTDIDGHKVVEKLCRCGHHKRDHADKEIIGKQIKKGDQYITPITYEKNKGHCTKHKCKCYKYEVGAVLLDNGKILKYSEFFGCGECGKYFGNKKQAKGLYWPSVCKSCAPKYYKERIDELDVEITSVKMLEDHLAKVYPILIKKTVEFEKVYGYDYDNYGSVDVDVSISMVVDELLDGLRKEKEKWEGYM